MMKEFVFDVVYDNGDEMEIGAYGYTRAEAMKQVIDAYLTEGVVTISLNSEKPFEKRG